MTRKYTLKRRAEKQDETRQRILEAVVALHEEVGPSRTTVSAIAERAGVQRLTVYRHFPDEPALFEACRDHWIAANPPPDPAAWEEILNPRHRVRQALRDLYVYYDGSEQMMANIIRDASLMPAVADVLQPFHESLAAFSDVLRQGWDVDQERQQAFLAALGHGLSFDTWRSLTREQGLSNFGAADLMAALVECAATGHHDRPSVGVRG